MKLKKGYSKLEQSIIDLFKKEKSFYFKEKKYNVDIVGKPRPSCGGGEPKTDVYIKGINSNESIEIKISVKMKHKNEWQESKVTKERAEAIFGEDWSKIIQQTTLKIKDKFLQRTLLYKEQNGTTKKDSVTMGWRLEITNKPRNLSAKIALSDEEIKDYIYMGTNLSEEKRNCLVDGTLIQNSGVAEYILYIEQEDVTSTKNILDRLIPIKDMTVPPTYLTFIANNYRMGEDKTDGSRPLAVYVDWKEKGGKIEPTLCFDEPLEQKGKLLVPNVKHIFEKLNVKKPSELSLGEHISKTSIVFDKSNKKSS